MRCRCWVAEQGMVEHEEWRAVVYVGARGKDNDTYAYCDSALIILTVIWDFQSRLRSSVRTRGIQRANKEHHNEDNINFTRCQEIIEKIPTEIVIVL